MTMMIIFKCIDENDDNIDDDCDADDDDDDCDVDDDLCSDPLAPSPLPCSDPFCPPRLEVVLPPSDENYDQESDEYDQGHQNDHHGDEDDQCLEKDHYLLVIPGQGVAIVITPNPPPDIQDDDEKKLAGTVKKL